MSPNPHGPRPCCTREALSYAPPAGFVAACLVNLLDGSRLREQWQQHDAEEFLSFLLDTLQSELEQLACSNNNINGIRNISIGGAAVDEDQWEEVVGKHNRSIVRRVTAAPETVVRRLFGIQLRTELRAVGARPSASVQPLYSLPLDIEADDTRSVVDALRATLRRELVDFSSSRSTSAVQRSLLERLPPVLVVQLKRFVYPAGCGAARKLSKQIDYPLHFVFPHGTRRRIMWCGARWALTGTSGACRFAASQLDVAPVRSCRGGVPPWRQCRFRALHVRRTAQ